MTEFERTVEAARLQALRRVVRTTFEPFPTPTIRITLGCGHQVCNRDAGNRVDLWELALGDEIDCPHCPAVTKH